MDKFFLLLFCIIANCFGGPSRYLYNSSQRIFRTGVLRQGANVTNVETTSAMTHLRPNVCSCTEIYAPVCGTNDVSYYNECQMQCDLEPDTEVTVRHQGNCIPF